MADPLARLALQSWCLRAWRDPDEIIARVRDLGITHIELCGYHVDPDDVALSERLLSRYLAGGLRVTAFGVHTFTGDRAQAHRVFSWARKAQAQAISADFSPGGHAIAQQLAEEYAIPVGVHNHGRRHRLGSAAALATLFTQYPGIGLYLDTAWMLDSGDDPVAVATLHRNRLIGVHLKDFAFDRSGKPVDVVTGTGNLALESLCCLLVRTAWQGSLTIEYEGDMDNPLPALRSCIAAIRSAFTAAHAANQPLPAP